jgi:transcriptional regulator with XRE-family HTH domain
MIEIGNRLRSERERLGLNQEDFAERGQVRRNTQSNYEKGDRSPDANYLAAIAAMGVDVQYVITGVRAAAAGLSADQSALLDAYGRAGPDGQQASLLVMEAMAAYQVPGQSAGSARQRQTDAELWRTVARSMPTSPDADLHARLTLVEWLAVVDLAFESEKASPAGAGVQRELKSVR